MTSETAKRGLWFATIVSVVLGAILAQCRYGNLLDARSLNVIGLVFILVVGLFAAFVAVTSRKRT